MLLLLFSHQVMSDFSQPHGLQHIRLLCPSLSPRVCSSSYALNLWCHPTIPSPCCPPLLPPSIVPSIRSFPVSQFFTSGGQSIWASASASDLPKSILGWFPLRLTGLISLFSKGLSRDFSNTTVEKHQFFSTLLSLLSSSNIHTWLLERP